MIKSNNWITYGFDLQLSDILSVCVCISSVCTWLFFVDLSITIANIYSHFRSQSVASWEFHHTSSHRKQTPTRDRFCSSRPYHCYSSYHSKALKYACKFVKSFILAQASDWMSTASLTHQWPSHIFFPFHAVYIEWNEIATSNIR